MERKIYLNLSITASISAILTSFLISLYYANGYMDFFVSTLPITVGILVLILIPLNIVAYFLTRNILQPIEDLSKNIMFREITRSDSPYKELDPFMETIKEQKQEIQSYIDELQELNNYRRDFTANVSHELKTPLTSINGFAEILATGQVPEEDSKKFGEIILKEGNKLLNLINSTISLSRLESTEEDFEIIDLKELVSESLPSLKLFAQARGVNIYAEYEDLSFRGNKRMLKELINNLVSNAIKYNKEGGQVVFKAYDSYDCSSLIIEVEDNGWGMEEDKLSLIFDRFYTIDKSRSKEASGTGLGLSIVKHIVALHQGYIKVESQLGKGSKFTVSLPKNQP